MLTSGNFLFRAPIPDRAVLEADLEARVGRLTGGRASVFVRSGEELAELLAANPFPREAGSDPSHLAVVFLRSAPPAGSCEVLESAGDGGETVRAVGRELFVYYPKGIGRSRLTLRRTEAAVGGPATARNWNTVRRLAALLHQASVSGRDA